MMVFVVVFSYFYELVLNLFLLLLIVCIIFMRGSLLCLVGLLMFSWVLGLWVDMLVGG